MAVAHQVQAKAVVVEQQIFDERRMLWPIA
jgi:hypothetical protein